MYTLNRYGGNTPGCGRERRLKRGLRTEDPTRAPSRRRRPAQATCSDSIDLLFQGQDIFQLVDQLQYFVVANHKRSKSKFPNI